MRDDLHILFITDSDARAREVGFGISVEVDPLKGLEAVEGRDWDLLLIDAGLAPELLERSRRLADAMTVALVADSPSLGMTLDARADGLAGVVAFPPEYETAERLVPVDRGGVDDMVGFPEEAPESALVGRSDAMLQVFETVAGVADSSAHLLIEGEPGTGKAAIAKAIHAASPRADGPWVELNVDALPESLLESELFGHEEGSYPWAVSARQGRLHRASGGTLFLDRLDKLPIRLQARLLDALKEGAAERVGGHEPIPFDVRIVATSRRSLWESVAGGDFLEDLYLLVSVVTLPLPPLRERGDDLVLLAGYFGALAARTHGKPVRGLTPEAVRRIESHDWPGNARELRNVMERAVLVSQDEWIRTDDLPDQWTWKGAAGAQEGVGGIADLDASLEEVEAAHIRRVIRTTNGNLSQAAQVLGIHRNTLRRKMRQYGIMAAG